LGDQMPVSGYQTPVEAKLPVHGFVLAGGKSSRMGVDKALLPFCGRPMVEIAVEKLREFCADVSIAGNWEERVDVGPGAGIEAGLKAARQPWVMFLPVDVPLVPVELLRGWVEAVLESGCGASYLVVKEQRQPAFCVMRRECLAGVSAALDRGVRRLDELLRSVAAAEVEVEVESWFMNVNTPEDLAKAEAASKGE